jgi:glycosyltransferase involved in cell wall biosynthesis
VPHNKILFYVPLPPPIHGAALINKLLVNSTLLNARFQIKVVSFEFVDDTKDIGKFSFVKMLKAVQRGCNLLYQIITFKPRLIYFNLSLIGLAFYRDSIYVVVLKALNQKMVYHLRTLGIKDQVQTSRVKKILFKYIFKDSKIICLSESLTNDVKDVYALPPFVVNDGIVDVQFGMDTVLKNNAKPTILFLSNLSIAKGIEEFVRSLHVVKSKGVSFNALIVGNGLDLSIQQVKNMIQEWGMHNDVTVLGPKYGNEKYQLLSQADIFVLPTHFEAFPGAILEAMQFSLPIISTRVGGIPDMIEEGITGILVEHKNVELLAEKIHYLLSNPLVRTEMGARARVRFAEKFTNTIMEKNMSTLLESLLNDV